MANIQWEELLHFLAGYLREHHPNVYNVLSRDAWEAELDRLMREMPAMHANQAKTAIAVFLAAIGDAHTGLRWEPEVVYPIGLYWFSEGLYVIHAQDEYNHLLDSRVLAINGCGVDQLVESVKQLSPRKQAEAAPGTSQLPHSPRYPPWSRHHPNRARNAAHLYGR